jgi:hypothetical protein
MVGWPYRPGIQTGMQTGIQTLCHVGVSESTPMHVNPLTLNRIYGKLVAIMVGAASVERSVPSG